MRSKSFQAIAVVFLVCVLFGQPAAGQKPSGQQPGGHLRIDEVLVDFTLETITITGEDFDFGGYLEVTLGQIPGDITGLCTPFPTTTILCDFSVPGLPLDGDYLLTVATGVGQSQSDEYDLTIGAVGPQGPQGPPGADGADGEIFIVTQSLPPVAPPITSTSAVATCPPTHPTAIHGYIGADTSGGATSLPAPDGALIAAVLDPTNNLVTCGLNTSPSSTPDTDLICVAICST